MARVLVLVGTLVGPGAPVGPGGETDLSDAEAITLADRGVVKILPEAPPTDFAAMDATAQRLALAASGLTGADTLSGADTLGGADGQNLGEGDSDTDPTQA